MAAMMTVVATALISRYLYDELKDWVPWVVRNLIQKATAHLPEEQRDRFSEEWQSHVNDVPGAAAKLWVAAGLIHAARKMSISENRKDSPYRVNRPHSRTLDPLFAALMLLFVAPVMGLLAVLAKLDSGRVLRRRTVVGLGGLEFALYSFQFADSLIARTSYKFSFHVLPNLINVLRGEVALVGPNPHTPDEVILFRDILPDYMNRTRVKPGLTGLSQICVNWSPTCDREWLAREWLKYDLYYVRNKSLKLDLYILFCTASMIFSEEVGRMLLRKRSLA
jgi:lipopolysaccharide/colanic/teichoic acid biosynthesis glycosyltransferase